MFAIKRLIVLLLLFFSYLVSAQELHTFSNGEVADAEKINENFQYVLENATGSGGCSAEQDGSGVIISCADGTSGVLAGAGTVVFVDGLVGEAPDISSIPTEFVLLDANDEVLAGVYSTQITETYSVYNIGPFNAKNVGLLVDNIDQRLLGIANVDDVSPYDIYLGLVWLYYTTESCSGPVFADNHIWANPSVVMIIEDSDQTSVSDDVIAFTTAPAISTLMKSRRRPGGISVDGLSPPGDCETLDIPQLISGFPMQQWIPPDTLVNAALPLTIEPVSP